MTTLLVLIAAGVLVGVFSFFTNAGLGDRKPKHGPGDAPSARDIEALLQPLATEATPITAARDGHAVKVAGRVEAVLAPFGDTIPTERWSARITPGDAGGTRARFIVGDAGGRATVEIPFGSVDVFTRGLSGWERVVHVPALAEGQRVEVFGIGKVRAPGYRDGAPELIVRATYIALEPPRTE